MNAATPALLLLLASPALAFAQTPIPFTAKVRIVHYLVAPSGVKKLVDVREGVYYRSADGTTLMRTHELLDGKPGGDSAVLTDPDGNVTRITYATREAIRVQDGSGPGRPLPFSQATGPRQIVNGVSCIVKPVLAAGCVSSDCRPGSKFGEVNTVCGSPEYNVIVHTDHLTDTREGILETVEDTYDFKQESPDPAAMRIPEGFTLKREIPQLPIPH